MTRKTRSVCHVGSQVRTWGHLLLIQQLCVLGTVASFLPRHAGMQHAGKAKLLVLHALTSGAVSIRQGRLVKLRSCAAEFITSKVCTERNPDNKVLGTMPHSKEHAHAGGPCCPPFSMEEDPDCSDGDCPVGRWTSPLWRCEGAPLQGTPAELSLVTGLSAKQTVNVCSAYEGGTCKALASGVRRPLRHHELRRL